ncbi:glycosyl hydrolase [Microbulbifer aggregans]|uniref:glycosyl hydrolase n=1 Tax=Microbulbifer aggregans TaxID=1769779 RepID=UPI001CFCFA36|nr:glycosyl hydrolase [Microbulbifer aggregans]
MNVINTLSRLCLGTALCCAPLAQAGFTSYGAGNISDTINPAGYGCVVDYGTWIHNAGVVEPGVSSCDPIGTPVPRHPQLVAPASNQPTMTHRWWGSVSFLGEMTIGDSADSAYITPDPVTARISNRGARVLAIPSGLQTVDNQTIYQIPDPFSEVFDGIAVGNSAYSNMDAYLKDYSDGSMTVQWRAGATPVMEATFVYGSPYVYFQAFAGNLVLRTKAADSGEKGIYHTDGNSLGVWTDVAGVRNYFLAVGDGSTQFLNPNSAEVAISGSNRLTLAWLPVSGVPDSPTRQYFAQYAQQPVDEVFIGYSVDRGNNSVNISHQYRYQGAAVNTLAGLQPLHWKNSAQPLSGYKARSARGVVQFAATSQFSYQLPFVGVLPYFPEGIGDYDTQTLQQLVQEYLQQGASQWNTHTDTYWSGKNYGKVAELAAIARSHGMTAEADQLINWLKGELEDWFRADTSGGLDLSKYFVYDSEWNTLLGFDESFGAQQQLNDHHFHYGYFVRAAAEICRVDAGWCSASAWGPMVEMLIRDYAGGRNDPMFPYLRNFDPANGFSWASGHANFVLGNNNESTSEAANAYGAIVLYGLITGNDDLVNRGMYLHASSTAAYWEYWNNLDRYRGLGGDYDNFFADYNRMTTSIIWGNGHVFSTWFSGAYAHILGIQGLPLSPLVLHIGQHPDYLNDYVSLGMSGESSNGKPSGLPDGHWRDVWWNIWAMTDGAAAVADFNTVNLNYTPEEGESKAHTYHWIHTYKALGHLASGSGSLSADYPAALAFDNNGEKTYLAYNFGGAARTVHFSDGTSFSVPAGQMSVDGVSGSSGGGSSGGSSGNGFDLTIEAEDYDFMAGVQTEPTSDTGGGVNVGWIDAGDWLAYADVQIPAAGTYQVEYRVASESIGGHLVLDMNAGATVLGELDVPVTGGWQNWVTVQHTVQMPAGPFDLGVYAAAGGWNINWLRIRSVGP